MPRAPDASLETRGARFGVSALRWTRSLDAAVMAAVVLLVASPLLFTSSGFGLDFTNYLWLTWAAGKELVAAGHINYFLNGQSFGVFYPWMAFDGGPLYTITGGIGELIGGHPQVAFVGVTTLVIAADYGAMLWLGRQFDLRGWTAHAPAMVVVTSAYYVTNLYGRGAWAEFMAVSSIAPLIASGMCLVRAGRWRPFPITVFVLSVVIFSGSHNITLVWGPTLGGLALIVTWLALGVPIRLPYRRLAMLAGLGIAGLLVNGWFLLPDIAYETFTVAHSIAAGSGEKVWIATDYFNIPSIVLDPFRSVPSLSSTPSLYIQTPDWFLAWGLLAGVLLVWRRSVNRALRGVWVGAVVMVTLLLCMILVEQFWSIISFPYNEIQFPLRLCSYVAYAVAWLVLAGVLLLQRVADKGGKRYTVLGLRITLIGACAISLGLCAWQLWVPETLFPTSYRNRGQALASVHTVPGTWYDPGFYFDQHAPIVMSEGGRGLVIPPNQVHGDHFAAWMSVPPGPGPIQTNISGGPYLVHVAGLRQIGRNSEGYAVVKRIGSETGPVHVVVETTHSAVITDCTGDEHHRPPHRPCDPRLCDDPRPQGFRASRATRASRL